MLGTITLTVGQPDSVSVAHEEEAPETMDTIQDDVAPQVTQEKVEKETPDDNDISAIEEKADEEKRDEANEVGFKKIFRFVGFKFTLKKDKSEEKEPVQLLTVKDKEGEVVDGAVTANGTKEESATAEEKVTTEENVVETEAPNTEADVTKDTEEAATTEVPAEAAAAEAIDVEAKEEGAVKECETSPSSQEVIQSQFRKLFNGGLFSNLRKKASTRKRKEEEEKEAAVEEETTKAEETADAVGEEVEKVDVEPESKEESPATTPEEAKPEPTPVPEITVEAPAPAADTTDETKPEEKKAESTAEGENAPVEVTSEAELLSSQEKAKAQGSPLKKLFTGAGLKKLSTKKQKGKKDAEVKLTESGEQVAEQLQSSTESAEGANPDSSASSPENSGEHVNGVDAIQAEPSQEPDGEVTSDGEKKKEGIIAWSSFKKLVTPKRRVKRSSESEDEATGEKTVKSATMSSTESAAFTEKCNEEEAKDDKPAEEEPKTENTEKLVSSTEESKKKMDTSVSWEALMCMGGAKKRTRRTSDSDDEETKIEEEVAAVVGEQEDDTAEAPVVTSDEAEAEAETDGEVVSSPEPSSSQHESTWDTLKRFMTKNKTKVEEKTEESSDQVLSDSEIPKEESSFSFRKFLPGRRKKKAEKQVSTEVGSAEEDSDTPAVVPLSEYEQEEPEVPAIVQSTVPTEDRSPSWIPAIVDADDKHDHLSDIPEEAENAATPKSSDITIAEDVTEDLSTAEEKPVVPAPAAEATPVSQAPQSETTEVVLEGTVDQDNETLCQTSVTVEDLPKDVANAEVEYEPPIEHAESKSNAIVEPLPHNVAMAICTGLETKEIAEVALEKPVTPTVECVAVISDALCAEVLLEDKPADKAIVTEDPVLGAQVSQVETTELELVNEMPEVQTAEESHDSDIEKVATFSSLPEEAEIVQPTEVSENDPKAEVVHPITPTVEESVHTESVEDTESAVEIQEKELVMEELVATEEITPVKEVVQAVSQEITVTPCDTTRETEPDIPVEVSAEECAIVKDSSILAAPLTEESDQAVTKETAVMEKVSVSVPVLQEQKEEGIMVAEAVVDTCIEAAESEETAVIEQVSEKMTDIKEEEEQAYAIEEHSMAIAQDVIQSAMLKMSEADAEPQNPITPTAEVSEPVEAVVETEKEIEIETEMPVITETPVVNLSETLEPTAEAPETLPAAIQVIDLSTVDVVESHDVPIEEEKKSEEGLKQAVEVNASEEMVVLEEVEELKLEGQTGGELEEVKEEQSKEEAETQEVIPPKVKEAADLCEEVKPLSEATINSEAPSEEMPEIHSPVEPTEDPSVEEEAAVEFDSNGPVDNVAPVKATDMEDDSPASQKPVSNSLPTLLEDPQTIASTEVAAPSQAAAPVAVTAVSPAETEKAASDKCAEVMAQVIEVIEEAVKEIEIEPVSTEITAAS